MSVPQLYLKFKGLLLFFEDEYKKTNISLEDIFTRAPHYGGAIQKQIHGAEEEYRNGNAHGVDQKITMAKRLFYTATKEIRAKRK